MNPSIVVVWDRCLEALRIWSGTMKAFWKDLSARQNMLVATVLFALMNVCVKRLSHLPTDVVVFFRGAIALLLCLGPMMRRRLNPFADRGMIKYLVLRGVFGTISLFLFFYTIQTIPLATAVTIQLLSPIFTVMYAQIVFKESTSIRQFVFLITSFLGVVLVKGIDTEIPWITAFIGIISAQASALAYTTIRKIGQRVDTIVIIFYFPLITTLVLMPRVFSKWSPIVQADWIWLILMGVMVQSAQIFMTKAYASDRASNFVNFSYLGVVYAVIIGIVMFEEVPNLWSVLGMLVIIGSVYGSSKCQDTQDIKKRLI